MMRSCPNCLSTSYLAFELLGLMDEYGQALGANPDMFSKILECDQGSVQLRTAAVEALLRLGRFIHDFVSNGTIEEFRRTSE